MCTKHLLDEVDRIRSNITLVEKTVFDIGFAVGCVSETFFGVFRRAKTR